MRSRYLIGLVLGLSLVGHGANAGNKYEAGQVWTFYFRGVESPARVIVGKTATLYDLGPTVHISIIGIPVIDPATGTQRFAHIWHLAFSPEALDASVGSQTVSIDVPPQFQERYNVWHERYIKSGDWLIKRPLQAVLKELIPTMTAASAQ